MDQAEGYLYSRRGETSRITRSVGSKVESLQVDKMRNMEMEQKSGLCTKSEETGNGNRSTWTKYQTELRKLEIEIETENAQKLKL